MQNTKPNNDRLYLASKDPNGAMIDLVTSTNQRCAVPKHLILENQYQPGDRISIKFGGQTLTIEGKNLLPIYKLINSHRILEIREGCPIRENEDKFETWIDSIVITMPNRSGQSDRAFPY